MNYLTQLLSSADISLFHQNSANFSYIKKKIDIDFDLIHNFLFF